MLVISMENFKSKKSFCLKKIECRLIQKMLEKEFKRRDDIKKNASLVVSDTLQSMTFARIIQISKHHITTLLFIGGFIFDLIILPEAGHALTIWIGALYLAIVAGAIALREWIISQNTASKNEQRFFSILTFIIAYFSGSSLSFVSVYAIRSAAFAVSWPLFIILLLCVLVNELVSSHDFRFTLDVGVFLIALLFFVVFNTPLLLKVQNDMTFVISLGITIVLSLGYLFLLQFTSESASEELSRLYALGVGIPMFIGMLYFLNVIPAVPLSLAKGGVYHSIVRDQQGDFTAVQEKDKRLLSGFRVPIYHMDSQDTGIYFFSAVSAPVELTAPLSHVWEYYDPLTKRWTPKTTIEFTLDGGREDGYRAYSQKENVLEGLWRVTVKVDDKRVVGRMKFYIVKDKDGVGEMVDTKL
jgi:hypothetical protein